MTKEFVKIDKDYVFKEIAEIYDMAYDLDEFDFYGDINNQRCELLDRLASLQAYCREGEENDR